MKPRQPVSVARRDKVAIPSGSNEQGLGDAVLGSRSSRVTPPPHTRAEDQTTCRPMALKCKECSTTYPLEARYVCERCFGPP